MNLEKEHLVTDNRISFAVFGTKFPKFKEWSEVEISFFIAIKYGNNVRNSYIRPRFEVQKFFLSSLDLFSQYLNFSLKNLPDYNGLHALMKGIITKEDEAKPKKQAEPLPKESVGENTGIEIEKKGFFCIATFTGLRVGDAHRMSKGDFHVNREEIHSANQNWSSSKRID